MGNGDAQQDKNGHVYVKLGWREYIKLVTSGLAVTLAALAAAIALSGIFAHMADSQIHQTEATKRRMIRDELSLLRMQMDRNVEHLDDQIEAGFSAIRRETAMYSTVERRLHDDNVRRIEKLEAAHK